MKLSVLNGAIRKTDGAVKIRLITPLGPVGAALVKSELLAGLKARVEAMGGDRATETGMSIDNGHLVYPQPDGVFQMRDEVDDAPLVEDIDIDDLLDDDASPADDDIEDLLA